MYHRTQCNNISPICRASKAQSGSKSLFSILFVICFVSVGAWAERAAAQAPPDFDGDGFGDVAIGVLENPGGVVNAGTVQVFYGSGAGGLAAAGNQIWHQNSAMIADVAEMDDDFGTALAVGDFDGDGFADLAIGVPLEDIGAIVDAGAVNVIYGSFAVGLVAGGNQIWHQNTGGIEDMAEANDHFGGALAAGDFNGDSYADLAIGVNLEDIGAIADAGLVNVIYGSPVGLAVAGDQVWTQNNPGILDVSEPSDYFGFALAAGDFNEDGIADLAIGVYLEDLITADAGAVNVIFGSALGLVSGGNQFWNQDVGMIEDNAEVGDFFGYSLTAGNFNGDGQEFKNCDLAVGVPGEDIDTVVDAGAVNVLHGMPGVGLTDVGNQFWDQNTLTIMDSCEAGDGFGSSLTAGDYNGDSYDDLVVGVWYEDLAFADMGAVNALYGTAAGLTDGGNQFWNQDSPGISGTGAASDLFGYALASVDFDADGAGDLVATVPYDEVGAIVDAGAMNVLYGVAGVGLASGGNQRWHQNSGGIMGVAAANDNFGISASVTSPCAISSSSSPVVESREANSGEFSEAKSVTEGSSTRGTPDRAFVANYPNPFNPATTISYSVSESGPVKLTVYNTLGQLVATLVDRPMHQQGRFDVRFDAAGLASGLYVYRLESMQGVQSKSMLLIK